MFEKAKIQTPNVWKSQKPEFQCLERPKFRIPMFGKGQNSEFQRLEKAKTRIPMFGKPQFRIPIFLEGRGW